MKEKPINELIDDYVTGQIRAEEKIYLEDLAAKDPEVAAQLNSALEAYNFLERTYYKQLKKKLQDFDRSIEVKDDLPSKKFVRPVVIGVIMISIFWMISYLYFKPENLVKRFYYTSTEQLKIVDSDDTLSQLWVVANEAFLKNDFKKAEEIYQLILSQSEIDDLAQSEWNFLLCQLAIHGATPEWRYKLDEMITQSDESIKGKAIELKKQLNSWIYKLTFLQFSLDLSYLKPRLI
ncbi:MAG: hypothetical protein ABIQ11_05785 [Saprospiraceae bacterium]